MSEPIVVQCPNCDAQLRIKNPALIGKKAPCPKCGQRFLLEAAEEPPEDEFDIGASNDDYGEPEDDYAAPPSRRSESSGRGKSARKKSGQRRKKSTDWQTPLLMGGGVLASLGVVAALVYGVMTLLKGGGFGGAPPDMAWLPNDTEMLVQLRVSEIADSAVVKKVLAEPVVAAAVQEASANFGLTLGDIERVSMGFPNFEALQSIAPGTQPRMSAVVAFKNPVDSNSLLEKFRSGRPDAIQTQDYAGRQLHVTGPESERVAFCFVDGKTAIFGSEAEVKQSLDSGGVCQAASRFAWADGKGHVMFVAVPRDPTVFDRGGMALQRTGPFGAPLGGGKASEEIEGMFGSAHLSQDLTLSYGVKSKSSSTARGSVTTMKKELDDAADMIALQRKNAGGGFNPLTIMLGPGADRILGHVENALRSADGSSSGSVCQVSITLPGEIVDEAKSLIGMAAMTGMAGGFGAMPEGVPTIEGGTPTNEIPSGPASYSPPGFPGGESIPLNGPDGTTQPGN